MVDVVQHFEDGTANPAWLRMRAGKLTGSRFADLMAKGRAGAPSTSRANLLTTLAVERLTGECVEVFVNAAMVRGTELEPKARSAYEANAGVLVEEVGFVASTERSIGNETTVVGNGIMTATGHGLVANVGFGYEF